MHHKRDENGLVVAGGKKFEMLEGSRAQVWHGTALKTSGGLTKTNLHMNKHGRIVSRKKFETARKEKRLVKAGYGTKKGKFGFVKIGSKKMRGGYSNPYGALDGAPVPGSGQMASGVYTDAYSSTGYTPKSPYSGGKKKRTRRRRRH